MAAKVTSALGGAGLWGVEFFLSKNGVYFSELSPRPHDTGMVTLANTQNLNEFELHARAILGLPIPSVQLMRCGASAVVLAGAEGGRPQYEGQELVLAEEHCDLRIFNKPSTRPYRRMAVVLCNGSADQDAEIQKERAIRLAKQLRVMTA